MSVIVVPDADSPNPMPSEGMLRTVCAYLDARRLLTTELFVLKPAYQHIVVRGEVVVADDADLAVVAEAIDGTLVDYFHPLRGGEDGQGWPFGGTVRYSRVYQRVFAVPGVASIEQSSLRLTARSSRPARMCPSRSTGCSIPRRTRSPCITASRRRHERARPLIDVLHVPDPRVPEPPHIRPRSC